MEHNYGRTILKICPCNKGFVKQRRCLSRILLADHLKPSLILIKKSGIHVLTPKEEGGDITLQGPIIIMHGTFNLY